MRESTVARVYAETLLALATEHDVVPAVAEEAAALRESLVTTPRLGRFLQSPEIGPEEKLSALRRGLEGRLSSETLRFLDVVVRRGRQELLPLILETFAELVETSRNRETVQVTSAVPLADDLRRRLVTAFERATGHEIVLRVSLEPALLGGLVVQVGDTRIDGSLRTRLETLRERMLRGAHAAATAAS